MSNKFFATCKLGLEALVSNELKALGAEVTAVHDARVDFTGTFGDMASALLGLRTAERVLMEVGSFRAVTFEELYEGVRAIDWKQYLTRHNFIHVNGKSAKSRLFSVSDCQSIAKKAIVDALFRAYGVSGIAAARLEETMDFTSFRVSEQNTAAIHNVYEAERTADISSAVSR